MLEKKLAELFDTVARGEQRVEGKRLELAHHIQFEVLSLFTECCKKCPGSLTSSDLQEFIQSNWLNCTQFEAGLIVKQYDSSATEKLSLQEFSQLVLPTTSEYLRDIVHTRKPTFEVCSEVKDLFVALLVTEQQLQVTLDQLRKELVASPEFNAHSLFAKIDTLHIGKLDPVTIATFLHRNGIVLKPEELNALQRRVSSEESITFNEFIDAILPTDPSARAAIPSSCFKKSLLIRRGPLKTVSLAELRESILAQPDFSVQDLYLLFDTYKKGRVSGGEVQETLKYLEISCSKRDLYTLMSTWCHTQDGFLTQEDLSSIFQCPASVIPKNQPFTVTTRSLLQQFFTRLFNTPCRRLFT